MIVRKERIHYIITCAWKMYTLTDKNIGLTLEETLLGMKEIGGYHALSYALTKWEEERIFTGPFSTTMEFFKLYLADDETINPKLVDFAAVMQGAIKNGLELMEKRNPSLHQRMKVHFERILYGRRGFRKSNLETLLELISSNSPWSFI